MMKLMKQKFETERLFLRPANNDTDLATYKHELPPEEYWFQFGREYDEHLLDNYDFTSFGVICYSVFQKSDGDYVGYVGIMPSAEDPEIGSLEYFTCKTYRNMGYCKEASRALIDAFQSGELTGIKGKAVMAETIYDNEASASVLQGLGFERLRGLFSLTLVEDPNDPEGGVMVGRSVDTYVLHFSAEQSSSSLTSNPELDNETLAVCA